jgi:hypothetical protein
MKKEVLNELDQMKYLFGYKAGKVISEQTKPPVQTGGTKDETQFFKDESGVVYKFPGITDQAKLEKFTDIGGLPQFVNLMGIDRGWLSNYERMKQQYKDNRQALLAASQGDKLWNLWTGARQMMWDIARLGVTGDKLRDRGIQMTLLQLPSGKYIQFATNDKDEDGPVMVLNNFFSKMGEFVNQKSQEIKA